MKSGLEFVQVDLKLKVCRGSSPKKILVREAKSYEAAKLILGTTKTHLPILSPVSVAKYCARKLPKCFSVYAVENGKVLFQREAIQTNLNRSQGCACFVFCFFVFKINLFLYLVFRSCDNEFDQFFIFIFIFYGVWLSR